MFGKIQVGVIVFCTFFFFIPFHGDSIPLHLKITRGNTKKVTVAFSQLRFLSDVERKISDSCTDVIMSDLNGTGIFNAQPAISYDLSVSPGGVPNSNTWTQLEHDIFLTGSAQEFSPGRIRVKLFLWDVASGKQLSGKSFNFEVGSWRRAAHIMADHIYSRVTGDSGHFDTKIVYLSELNSSRKISVMDQDGKSNTYIAVGNKKGVVSSPKLSPNGKLVVYILNTKSSGEIVLYDTEHETTTTVASLGGIGISAEFSPTSDAILFSESKDGSANVYTLGLEEKRPIQLTDNEFVNISASHSPDGKYVVFSSDRTGTPHLYIMNSDGSDQKKISSGAGKYMTPVWSPRGDLIAFTKVKGNSCSIGIMRPDGSKEQTLAVGYLLDSPSWAPNGKAILFTKHESSDQKAEPNVSLVVANINGAYSRVIRTLGKPISAHWSHNEQD
ncbi:MAG: translocation protein TolB [Aaplasma endosymbiont of Hyalomma asiaticum]